MTDIPAVSRRDVLKMILSGITGQALAVHSLKPMGTSPVTAPVVTPVRKVLHFHEIYEIATFFIRNRGWLHVFRQKLQGS